MGRRGYPAEFRRKVLDLVESGRPVTDVARALGISDQTIYTWRRQDRIDKGLEPGLTSGERSELAARQAADRGLGGRAGGASEGLGAAGEGGAPKRRFQAIAVMVGEGLS